MNRQSHEPQKNERESLSGMNVDQEEISKFSDIASRWWDLNGDLRTLHQINPSRIDYIKKNMGNANNVIDIGCGGGILTESLAKLGLTTTGVDMSKEALQVAKMHILENAKDSPLSIEYLHTTAEKIAGERPAHYDVVTCLEMLEHVPNPQSVVHACAALVKPGGFVFFSTINRNAKSYLFAILGAEYILQLLPKGTHDYAKFIKPHELDAWGREAGLTIKDMIGIHYNPITKHFSLDKNVDVNYIVCMQKNS